MTRTYLKQAFAGIFALILALVIIYVIPKHVAKKAHAPEGAPVFTWSYETSEGTYEIPKTAITLIATYPAGEIIAKKIDVVEGSCNDYPTPDNDVYAQSTMIICYAAGYGHYYKVVENETGYEVMHKDFEEATPEYEPPVTEFEAVANF